MSVNHQKPWEFQSIHQFGFRLSKSTWHKDYSEHIPGALHRSFIWLTQIALQFWWKERYLNSVLMFKFHFITWPYCQVVPWHGHCKCTLVEDIVIELGYFSETCLIAFNGNIFLLFDGMVISWMQLMTYHEVISRRSAICWNYSDSWRDVEARS